MANAAEPEGLGYSIPALSSPTPEQRAALSARQADLARWLAPAGEARVKVEAAVLFDCLARKDRDETGERELLAVYGSDLADLPAFALAGACKAFRLGERGDGRFVPKIAEIRAVALEYARPLSDERRKIHHVLHARIQAPISVERRGDVSKLVEGLKADFAATSALLNHDHPRRPSVPADHLAEPVEMSPEEKLEALALEFRGRPTKLSGEMTQKLNLPTEQET